MDSEEFKSVVVRLANIWEYSSWFSEENNTFYGNSLASGSYEEIWSIADFVCEKNKGQASACVEKKGVGRKKNKF